LTANWDLIRVYGTERNRQLLPKMVSVEFGRLAGGIMHLLVASSRVVDGGKNALPVAVVR
jgi:hypothetical protein